MTLTNHWITFPTAFGFCGVSWNSRGVTSFHLPETSEKSLEKHLKRITGNAKASTAPPSWIKNLIKKVKAHLKSNAQDFSDMPLHFDGLSEFVLSVYHAAQKIPSGTVVTYGELATLIGRPKAGRAVGNALAGNPIPLIVPCHRVITSSGKLGGFSAHGGVETKAALLACEGAGPKTAQARRSSSLK